MEEDSGREDASHAGVYEEFVNPAQPTNFSTVKFIHCLSQPFAPLRRWTYWRLHTYVRVLLEFAKRRGKQPLRYVS